MHVADIGERHGHKIGRRFAISYVCPGLLIASVADVFRVVQRLGVGWNLSVIQSQLECSGLYMFHASTAVAVDSALVRKFVYSMRDYHFPKAFAMLGESGFVSLVPQVTFVVHQDECMFVATPLDAGIILRVDKYHLEGLQLIEVEPFWSINSQISSWFGRFPFWTWTFFFFSGVIFDLFIAQFWIGEGWKILVVAVVTVISTEALEFFCEFVVGVVLILDASDYGWDCKPSFRVLLRVAKTLFSCC